MFRGTRETQEGVVNTLVEAMQKSRNAATLVEVCLPWAEATTKIELTGIQELLDQAGTSIRALLAEQVKQMEKSNNESRVAEEVNK